MRALLIPLLLAVLIPIAAPASAQCTSDGQTVGTPGGGGVSYSQNECAFEDGATGWWYSYDSTEIRASEAYTGLAVVYRHHGYGYGDNYGSSENDHASLGVGSSKGNIVPSAFLGLYDSRYAYGDSCWGGSGANGHVSWGPFAQSIGGPSPVGGCSDAPSPFSLLP